MRTPAVLVTGVEPDPVSGLVVGLQFDLPRAVVVRHHIDVTTGLLERVVSDVEGLVERVVVELDHTCVSCALREDVLPTLERLARSRRWSSIVAHLPVAAGAGQLCELLVDHPDLAVAAVVVALAGPGLADDLVGDDLLAERGLHTSWADRRGVGEVACSMVEHADLVVLDGPAPDAALARALARPGALVVDGTDHVDGRTLLAGLHHHPSTHAFVAPTRPDAAATFEAPPPSGTWRLDLRADRPFHPRRLLDGLAALGSGRHRSRGCFSLPTRPGQVVVWDGAGGQVSIGDGGSWGGVLPGTRLLLTGLGQAPSGLVGAFESLLVQPGERVPTTLLDGFEPWLGPIRAVA